MHISHTKVVVLMNFSAFFSGMVFYAPVATLYRQSRGISIWQMSIIEAVSLALMMALELPWGYISDRIGYRRTLVLSFSFLLVSKIVFFGADSFSLFLLERILLAIAFSALSGVDIAYLHRCGATHKELAQYQGCMFLGLLAVAFVFPFLAEVYAQSASLTIVSHLFALLCILLLPRERGGGGSLRSSYGEFGKDDYYLDSEQAIAAVCLWKHHVVWHQPGSDDIIGTEVL